MLEDTVQLHNQDSYEYIETLIKDNVVVNHIITDPPYNIFQERIDNVDNLWKNCG